MDSILCVNCQKTSSVTLSAQNIRCHGCQRMLLTGDAVFSELNKEWRQYQDKIRTEPKGIRSSLRKRFMCSSNIQYSLTGNVPIISLNPSNPPPRGKRAFICGVTYKKQKYELKGSLQDFKNMKDLLVEQFRFPVESILILAEEEPYMPPTKKNIKEAFKWLMKDIQFGDSLVFYFSGHGMRQRDFNGDEKDGYDETICPVDYEKNGRILDNDINKAIVGPLTRGVTLHAIVDSCHSGTILDLPYVYKMNKGKWDDNHPPSGANKDTSGGKAICFSACEDYQQAADTSAFSPEKEMTGAMTCTLIKAIKEALSNNKKLTYQGILDSIHESLKQPQKLGFLSRVFHRKILQDPMLSSSEVFSISTEFKL